MMAEITVLERRKNPDEEETSPNITIEERGINR